jgi:hypothetical protein
LIWLQIRLPANPSQAFNVKQTDTFNIKASDVGSLNYVIMRIEATGAATQVGGTRAHAVGTVWLGP